MSGRADVLGAAQRALELHALAVRLCGEKEYARAVEPLVEALTLEPQDARRVRDLAVVYSQLGRWRDILRVLSPIVRALDERTQALFFAAAVHAGMASAALETFQPLDGGAHVQDADLLCEYGRALHAAGRWAEGEAVLLRCVNESPGADRAHDDLSSLYHLTGRGDLALSHAQAFLASRPSSGYAHLRVATMLSLRGRLEESRDARLLALARGLTRPTDWTTALKLALCDTHEDGVSIAAVCASRFDATVGPVARSHRRRARRAGRLRVGYLSSEFEVAPAHYFLNPFLLNHDRESLEVFLYDTSAESDGLTRHIAHLGERVRRVGSVSDDDLLAQVDEDDIDVLVDLVTHFPGNRLELLHGRAAPIQASWPNCPSTTGSTAVDYLLSDRWTSPEGTEREYTERLHRLDSGYLVYSPPSACPAPASVAAVRNGFVTFGIIQQLMKIGPDVWDAIARVLLAAPDSRLLMHNSDRELARTASATRQFVSAQLDARGVDPVRMRVVGPLSHTEHLELLGEIDVALDSWPFTGTTTTCECLWMGVPVVTRAGHTHASRVSAGLLGRLGLHELIATDTDGYVSTAVRLAQDRDTLVAHRATLRARALAGGLTDGRALAHCLEQAYLGWGHAAGRL